MSKYNYDVKAILNQGKKKTFEKKEEKLGREERFQSMFFPTVPKGQSEATFTFRIIPPSTAMGIETPFEEVEFHFMYMKNSKKYELFTCLKQLGQECPLCDTHDNLMATGNLDDKETAKQYRRSTFYIVRGIERGKEQDGIKFWRFKKNFQGKGEFDKLQAKMKLGIDVVHPETGFDIIISCGLNDKKKSTITDISTITPSRLAKTEEEIDTLIENDIRWTDVFLPKEASYLEDVVNGTAQYWDKDLKMYVKPSAPVDPEDVAKKDNSYTNLQEGIDDVIGGGKVDKTDEVLLNKDVDEGDLPF